jgi:hypothetical protein
LEWLVWVKAPFIGDAPNVGVLGMTGVFSADPGMVMRTAASSSNGLSETGDAEFALARA